MKKAVLRWAKNTWLSGVLLSVCMCGTGVLSLYFSAFINRQALFHSYLNHPLIVALNLLPCVWLALLLWAAVVCPVFGSGHGLYSDQLVQASVSK